MRIKEHEVDWSPLADIKPARVGRGYSLFTEEEGERIRDFYRNSSVHAVWIARYFQVNIKSIDNCIYRRIKYGRPVTKTMNDADFKRLHKRYMKGETLGELSTEVKCSPRSLKQNFTRLGLAERPRYKADPAQVAYLLRKGKTVRQLAERFNVKAATIYKIRSEIRGGIL